MSQHALRFGSLLLSMIAMAAACSKGGSSGGDGDGDGDQVGDGDAATGGDTSSGGNPSDGGSTTGGGPGTGGSNPGTGGGTALPETRSAGCDVGVPAEGGRTIAVNAQDEAYIVSLPSDYNPATAYPLGFAFHGFGRTHQDCQNGDCAGFQSVMEQEAVLVYMKSTGEGWEQNEVREQNVDFFEAVLDSIRDEACIDESRVFVAGTSSGAHFSNILGCRFGDRLLAIAPVAGYLPETDCVGQVAAVVIHGVDDSLETGETARDFWVSQNNCTATTLPDLATAHQQIRTARDTDVETEACVDYQGCDAGFPVRWCEHSYGGYDDSTHGWPPSGGQMIWDFVSQF